MQKNLLFMDGQKLPNVLVVQENQKILTYMRTASNTYWSCTVLVS